MPIDNVICENLPVALGLYAVLLPLFGNYACSIFTQLQHTVHENQIQKTFAIQATLLTLVHPKASLDVKVFSLFNSIRLGITVATSAYVFGFQRTLNPKTHRETEAAIDNFLKKK